MLNQLRTYGILVCADFELCRHGAIARLQTCGQKNSSMWWSSCTFVLTMVILGRGFSFQRTFFKNISWIHPQQLMTRLTSRTQGATQAQLYVLCALYGAFDAIWETYCYWLMGALTNNTHMSAWYSGFYIAIQNAGAAFAGQVNAKKTAILTASHWLGPVDSRRHVCNPCCMFSAGNPASWHTEGW